jgi:hypothetical protein
LLVPKISKMITAISLSQCDIIKYHFKKPINKKMFATGILLEKLIIPVLPYTTKKKFSSKPVGK